jgi:AcrR family transcriptional regulator
MTVRAAKSRTDRRRNDRRRVTKRPDERRVEIMDAAVHVFARKGVARTTVADITEGAGVAKGTFYLYFDSKEHLLGALKERYVDGILERAASLYERVGREDWWALGNQTVESFVDFTFENRELIEVVSQEGTPQTSEIFRECARKVDAMFAAGIRAGIEAGAFRDVDPEMMAPLMHHAVEGVLHSALLHREEIDRDRLVAAAQDMIRRTLTP